MFYPYAGKELSTGAKAFNVIGSLIGALAGVLTGTALVFVILWFSEVSPYITEFMLGKPWMVNFNTSLVGIADFLKLITLDYNPMMCALVVALGALIVAAVIILIVWFVGKLIWGKK